MMKKIIITGATSMVGAALINRLVLEEHIEKIYAITRVSIDEKKEKRIPSHIKVQIIRCDMDEYHKLPYIINDTCDVFYHLSWPRTPTYDESYDEICLKCDAVKGVMQAVELAKELGCKKFIGAGTYAEYGIHDYYSLETLCNPVRVDGALHLAAGNIARIISEKYGMNCIWMRIFSIYGINDRANSMISSTIDKLMKDEHCSFTMLEQKWDYLYEDDAAEAFYLVGERIEKSKVYNLAYGKTRPMKEYVYIIRELVSPNADLGIGEIPYPENPIMKMEVDISDLVNDTGWIPKVDFLNGIENIYANKCGGKYGI